MAVAAKGPEFCQARSEKGGLACRAKYGSDFFSYIAKQRKTKKGWTKAKARKTPVKDTLIQNLFKAIESTPA